MQWNPLTEDKQEINLYQFYPFPTSTLREADKLETNDLRVKISLSSLVQIYPISQIMISIVRNKNWLN